MQQIKRHFYNGTHYTVDEEKQMVILHDEFFKLLKNKKLWGKFGYKKVTGSWVGEVLGINNYAGEFSAYCKLARLAMPIMNTKYIDAGNDIEPKVVDAIEKMTGKKVTTYEPADYNWDFFADKDDVVGGLPDGYIEADKNIIEIKTTGAKNVDRWNKYGVPKYYTKQAELYAYLIGAKSYTIVATFLEESDYANSKDYPIKERKIKTWKYDLDKAEAEKSIKQIKDWHAKYTSQSHSPQWDISKDADLIEWLKIKNADELNAWIKKEEKR